MTPGDALMPEGGARLAPVVRWRGARRTELDDWLVEEVPVALEFNGISHAVMLATPLDLEDFALGFGLAEGILASAADLYGCEIVESCEGITVQLEVSSRSLAGLKERRRVLVGRTGCGLCGTESLSQVQRPLPAVPEGAPVSAAAITRAVNEMRASQVLCQATGSVHAAAWCSLDGTVELLREDVGRHNALDKLIGAAARGKTPHPGFIAVTSRASVEMVQKAVVAGARLMAAVSAPTTLAVATAGQAGLSLVGLVRGDDLVIYTHPQRVLLVPPKAP
ncbi:MAG TPA: formate dehydrogenase accessory sulfurtransferase FdhD [Ideonella sp.]|nr:formate dehydrogenase accessory sulfurtransferase FdhD [Ideonella sp.]